MPKAVKRKAPSRTRYEEAHPTVSCRVPKELYERLQTLKEQEDQSFADILKIGLGILELQAKKEAEIRKKGYEDGYRKGYAEAVKLLRVTYPCIVCGGMLTVTTSEEKQAIQSYMQEHSWRHAECPEKRR